MSKSSIMRSMYFDEGRDVKEISKEMGCIYGYVYGVIERECVKRGVDMREKLRGRSGSGESKSQRIRDLYNEGLEIGDICRKFVEEGVYVNYSYVWSIVDKLRKQG